MKGIKYPVIYEVLFPDPPVTRDEIEALERGPMKEKNFGACHSIIIASIVHHPNSKSYVFFGYNGVAKRPITPDEEFSAWAMWAADLAKKLPDGGARKKLCQEVSEALRQMVSHSKSCSDPLCAFNHNKDKP